MFETFNCSFVVQKFGNYDTSISLTLDSETELISNVTLNRTECQISFCKSIISLMSSLGSIHFLLLAKQSNLITAVGAL